MARLSIPDPRKRRAGLGFSDARWLLLGYSVCARCRRHPPTLTDLRAATRRERSLKNSTNRFRPRRNVGLTATEALDRVQKLVLQPDVDSVSGVSRYSLVHGLNLPMHQLTLIRETLFA
jgi:hypothetical protein